MKPKSVTIELTPKQQEKLRRLTGEEHTEVRFEVSKGRGAKKALAVKSAPSASRLGKQFGSTQMDP